MKQKILHYLQQLESEKQIKILLACETGSRAWGFPSPDSDFDVRMIYVHELDWYLTLKEKTDSIERMYENNDIDITGWDLRKALRLLRKSNAALLERIQSPILYQFDAEFMKGIQEIAQANYSRIATVHHYLSMAKKTLEEIEGKETYKLKKFFYALRASTACKWIIERTEMPRIEFPKMLAGLELPDELLHRIQALIDLKSGVGEAYLHEGEEALLQFMRTCIDTADRQAKSLPPAQGNMDELNSFFRKMINRS